MGLNGSNLIDKSNIELIFDDGIFGRTTSVTGIKTKKITESYQLITGKAKDIKSISNQNIISLRENSAPFKEINLNIRVLDDGAAFRFEFPQQKNKSKFTLLDENVEFKITGNPKLLALYLINYQSPQ